MRKTIRFPEPTIYINYLNYVKCSPEIEVLKDRLSQQHKFTSEWHLLFREAKRGNGFSLFTFDLEELFMFNYLLSHGQSNFKIKQSIILK